MNKKNLTKIAEEAKSASLIMACMPTDLKNQTLLKMADAIENNIPSILDANSKDLDFARRNKITASLIARLALNENKVYAMAQGIRSVSALPDPIGQRTLAIEIDEGLTLHRETCPLGVIGAIFESRPDALLQISSLCLKSGNAVVLKGGTEAQNSNSLLFSLVQEAMINNHEVPSMAVQMIETRSEVMDMLNEDKNIDLIIPRGSNDFVRYIQDNTRIPVLGHSEGICHGYIDCEANIEKSIAVVLDSKIQYAAACNAMETLLIHDAIAPKILPLLIETFYTNGVELLGCEETCKIFPELKPASPDDWDTEYTDLKLSIKLVFGLEEAIRHINIHGSGHTDVILTEKKVTADRFLSEVDSSSVIVNASTRFADGYRFGLGAEIGISTNKTHARGPVGLEGLIIYKYKIIGDGHIVAQYVGEDSKPFIHRKIN